MPHAAVRSKVGSHVESRSHKSIDRLAIDLPQTSSPTAFNKLLKLANDAHKQDGAKIAYQVAKRASYIYNAKQASCGVTRCIDLAEKALAERQPSHHLFKLADLMLTKESNDGDSFAAVSLLHPKRRAALAVRVNALIKAHAGLICNPEGDLQSAKMWLRFGAEARNFANSLVTAGGVERRSKVVEFPELAPHKGTVLGLDWKNHNVSPKLLMSTIEQDPNAWRSESIKLIEKLLNGNNLSGNILLLPAEVSAKLVEKTLELARIGLSNNYPTKHAYRLANMLITKADKDEDLLYDYSVIDELNVTNITQTINKQLTECAAKLADPYMDPALVKRYFNFSQEAISFLRAVTSK